MPTPSSKADRDRASSQTAASAAKKKTTGTAAGNETSAAKSTDDDASKASEASQPGVAEQMRQQHRQIEALLTEQQDDARAGDLAQRIADLWIPHTLIEEQLLMPALEQAGAREPAVAEAAVRRDVVKVLLSDLTHGADDPQAAAKLAVLSSELESLIALEERPETGVLALAEAHDVDLNELRPEIERRRAQMQADTEGGREEALEPASLRFFQSGAKRQGKEYSSMPYESNTRERDRYGRFQSDDDDRRSNRSSSQGRDRDENGRFTSDDDRGYRSRSSRDYDDDYRRSGSNGGGPGRDENGRFTSSRDDDDGRRYRGNDRDRDENGRYMSEGSGSRSRSRYESDDDGRGWHGDPRGHAEAAREGWEHRRGGGSYSQSRYDDDDRRSSRSRDDDDGRGWHGDPRGHAEAAREGWEHRRGEGGYRSARYEDDDDRRGGRGDGGRGDGGHGGWFGDSRGHSEASREGWDNRRGERSSRSRYEDDDDDRRGGGRGHGGWFGDSEGHSEASRRGWEDRR